MLVYRQYQIDTTHDRYIAITATKRVTSVMERVNGRGACCIDCEAGQDKRKVSHNICHSGTGYIPRPMQIECVPNPVADDAWIHSSRGMIMAEVWISNGHLLC